MADWESAKKVQKNSAGEYRAMIGGEWVPVAKAQKNPAGEYRVMRNAPAEVGAGATPKEGGILDAIKQGAGNLAAGAVRGAGSIGSTILWPADKLNDMLIGDRDPTLSGLVTGKQPLSRNEERRQQIDQGLQAMGAEPDSMMYQGGKLAGEIAGTAGAGGVMANGMRAVPALAKFAPVVESGGFGLGGAATGNAAANAALRAAGGAIQGGAQAGMVDPSQAGTGAMVGAVAPGAIKAAGAVGSAIGSGADSLARKLMASALKPTIKQWRTGQADRAISTMLDEGLNATGGGVEKIGTRIHDLNAEILNAIQGSGATVDRSKVLSAIDPVRARFANQVSPTGDLAAIQSVADDFAAHPAIASNSIPVMMAQQLKQGTYRTLKGKYGEVGSAATEAQKALARGLKEEVAGAVPAVAPLNARESSLLDALAVAERRSMMDANKNPVGLAAIAPSPAMFAAFLADRSGALKSLAARGLHGAANPPIPQALPNLMEQYGLLGAPSVMATSP